MAKTIDFPTAVREFGKALSNFSHRYYDYDIFSDFIDYVIASLLWEGSPQTRDTLTAKYGNEYPKFLELYRAFLVCMQNNLKEDNDWYDVLGEVYETIASRSKCSWLGQFFTPATVCDFMAQLQIVDLTVEGKTRTDARVNDCACGSGRTLLALNKVAPGNKLYAEDLDPICTKMAAINLAFHACKGQVCNMNSLNPEDWRFGYEINPWLYMTGGIPHILPITKEQSYTYSHWELRRRQIEAERNATATTEKPKPKPIQEVIQESRSIGPGVQLKLF